MVKKETVFFDSIERCRQDSEDGSSDSEDGGFSAHALASSALRFAIETTRTFWQERLTLHNLLVTSLCLFFLFVTSFYFFSVLAFATFLSFCFFLVCFLSFPGVLFTFYKFCPVLSFLPFFSSVSLIFVVLLSSGSLDSVHFFLPLLDLCCLFLLSFTFSSFCFPFFASFFLCLSLHQMLCVVSRCPSGIFLPVRYLLRWYFNHGAGLSGKSGL